MRRRLFLVKLVCHLAIDVEGDGIKLRWNQTGFPRRLSTQGVIATFSTPLRWFAKASYCTVIADHPDPAQEELLGSTYSAAPKRAA
jgi:hypothetical protein